MSFPRYPRYKDSGVEWLGEVPEHWEVTRLKRMCDVFPSNVDKKSHEGEKTIRLCNYTDVYYNERIEVGMDFMEATASDEQIVKFTLRGGDTIITKDSETADDIAIAAFVPHDLPGVVCGYHLSMIRPFTGTCGAFVKRLFDSSYAKSRFAVLANGLTRVGLGQYELDNIELPKPPETEQQRISSFLDHETAKIDALIAEQQRLIDLLKEKRQAVISHAVTKGLNPNVRMRDSGIEWLGEVPEHWEVRPLRWYSACCSGDGLPTEAVESVGDEEHAVRVIGGNGLMGYTDRSNVLHPVLAVGRVGALCGNVHVVDPPAWITDNALVLDPRRNAYDLRFLAFVLRCRNMNEIASKTAQPLITGTQVGDQRVPSPPMEEQTAITGFLDTQLPRLDALTSEVQLAIDLLQERRTALISAAVTGQIDVRGFQPAQAA